MMEGREIEQEDGREREEKRSRISGGEKTLGPIHEDGCRSFSPIFFNSEPSASEIVI